MSARFAADRTAMREELHDLWHRSVIGCPPHQSCSYRVRARHVADALLASGVVTPLADAVREAKAEALRFTAARVRALPPGSMSRVGVANYLETMADDFATDDGTTDPGLDRPAVAEDGQDPRNSGVGAE